MNDGKPKKKVADHPDMLSFLEQNYQNNFRKEFSKEIFGNQIDGVQKLDPKNSQTEVYHLVSCKYGSNEYFKKFHLFGNHVMITLKLRLSEFCGYLLYFNSS